MSQYDTPLNAAHQHAANADEHMRSGYLVLATEEHQKAAEAYMTAVERSNDESTKRTLRMLYNEHCKAVKELQRRIEKLRLEGKDVTLPQRPDPPQPSAMTRPSSQPGASRSAPSPPPHRPLTDSQNTVDESFMLLAGQRSDPGDAFNQFWNIMQGMLENLSQPVAFATAPLGNSETGASSGARTPLGARPPVRDGSMSSDTDIEEPMLSRFTRRIGIGRDGRKPSRLAGVSVVSANASTPLGGSDDEVFDEGDELSESFCLIPVDNEPSPLALKKENASLKSEVELMKKRLEATERVLHLRKEQDTQLRDSIVQATREAQRAMGASVVAQRPNMDFSALNMNVPTVPLPGMSTGREAQYGRRIQQLEEELRGIRAENERNKAMLAKYRERWDKLKESAKRKKEAKGAGESTSVAKQQILEEPEAEQELDDAPAR